MSTEIYGSVAEFRNYCAMRSYAIDLDADDEEITSALLVASEFIDGKYGGSFERAGTEKTGGREQERAWPRTGFRDRAGYLINERAIPIEVQRSTFEAARRQLNANGSLLTDFTLESSIKQASVDGAVSVTFAGASSAEDAQVVMPIIDRILAPLIGGALHTSSSLSVGSVRG